MVEIAKALALDARILILDEPTSSLTLGESRLLFGIMDELRGAGLGLIFISHRLEEVLGVADRITVLRDGKPMGTLARAEASYDRLAAMMVGRPLTAWFPDRTTTPSEQVAFEVRDLVVPGTGHGVSFAARRGEILGFAGLVGAGRTELMQTIFGITPARAGSMLLEGKPFNPRRPSAAIRDGVYLAPEDRKRDGLVLPMSVAQNISLPAVGGYSRLGFLKRSVEAHVADQQAGRLRIRCQSIRQKVVNLSGGNQQKVVLGKWLAMSPRVLIVDEPTRGIDVGAKGEIYRHLAELTAQGVTILMVSSDMEEVIGMSDRVVVMQQRQIRGIVPRSQATQERIVALMTGAAAQNLPQP
jgi:ribose transport system ATP-binding protein